MRIGFVGLGQMGRGMAQRLLDAGQQLIVWNRSPAAAEALAQRGAVVARRVEDALQADVVVSMLADDRAVQAVWLDAGLLDAMPRSCLHLNMASIGLELGERMVRAHAERSIGYVAAPVFGRPEVAARGELDIVAAGSEDALRRCEPIFAALGRRTFVVGSAPQHANIVKIARNFMLSAIIESLGEAFALVERNGVAPQAFLDIITQTSMSAPAFVNYGRMMLTPSAQPTFPLRLGLKDVELAIAAAAAGNVPLPTAELIRSQHIDALAHGYGDRDWAELGNWIAERAGIARRNAPPGA